MLASDTAYEGVFYTAVRTTGIFCRPSCPARKPKPENVDFYSSPEDAMAAGFRPCKRCKPLDASGRAPDWIKPLLALNGTRPERRITDDDIVGLGIDPVRLRRWFKSTYGMTFHTYARARRVGVALGRINGGDSIDGAAYDAGYESLSGFRDAFASTVGASPGRRGEKTMLVHKRLLTPLGPMLAMAEDRGIVLLEFLDRPILPDEVEDLKRLLGYAPVPGEHAHIDMLERELAAYFEGELTEFTTPLYLAGTEFQKAAWTALLEIPYGQTRNYGEQARVIGRPGASRAVGRANGQNRISIVVPCHRVIGADGSLTGYGGGQPRKRFLLDLEARVSGQGSAANQLSLFGTA